MGFDGWSRGCRTGAIGILAAMLAVMPAAAHPGVHDEESPALPLPVPPALATSASPVETVAAFHAALTRGDLEAALDLLADDVLIFESGGVERSRAEYASHHLAADAAFSAGVQRELVSQTHSEHDDTAWVTSVETVTGAYRARAINIRSVETMLLRRDNARWQIFHIHWSSADLTPRD